MWHQAHLKDLEKRPHVEPADTKRDSKYSRHNYEGKQKSEPHSDGDANPPAQQVVSRECKPSHAAQQRTREQRDCTPRPDPQLWDKSPGPFEACVSEASAKMNIRSN